MKSLYLSMNENQHVGKVGNAFSHARARARARAETSLASAARRVCTLAQSTAICAITFSVLLSRGSHEFLPASGMMEYYRAKQLKLRHINQPDPG